MLRIPTVWPGYILVPIKMQGHTQQAPGLAISLHSSSFRFAQLLKVQGIAPVQRSFILTRRVSNNVLHSRPYNHAFSFHDL